MNLILIQENYLKYEMIFFIPIAQIKKIVIEEMSYSSQYLIEFFFNDFDKSIFAILKNISSQDIMEVIPKLINNLNPECEIEKI